jgi:ATP-dependent DNA ligase
VKEDRVHFEAMEALARSVDAILAGQGWQYEPKWDGLRCLLSRDSDVVALYSNRARIWAAIFPRWSPQQGDDTIRAENSENSKVDKKIKNICKGRQGYSCFSRTPQN